MGVDNILMQCMKCEEWVPKNFINPFYTNGEYYYLDPECGLEFKNEIHGSNHKTFSGGMAQQLLEDFRKWKDGKEVIK